MITRVSRKKNSVYSVLIVCEGQNSERKYFEEFEKYLNENFQAIYPNGIKFIVFPVYPFEETIDDAGQFLTRKTNKRNVYNFESVINEDIEDKYFPAPVRWVRYAQKQAENSGFNLVWSVFDYDNRPLDKIKEAYELADESTDSDDGVVHISFSSYSFEYWLLLHYELCLKYIGHSECREKKVNINCGTFKHSNPKDCKGTKCLGGYLRVNGYDVGYYNKSTKSTFPALVDFINKARYHSNYVKSLPANAHKEIWEMKPVTTVDNLIDILINFKYKINWQFDKCRIVAKKFILTWSINDKKILRFDVSPIQKNIVLINRGEIKLMNINFDEYLINERVFINGEKGYTSDGYDVHSYENPFVYISVIEGDIIHVSEL